MGECADCILSKGMRVFSKENSSGRGYAWIVGPLYPGPQRAAMLSVSVGPVCIYYVRVGDSTLSVCFCVKDLVFLFLYGV